MTMSRFELEVIRAMARRAKEREKILRRRRRIAGAALAALATISMLFLLAS